MSTQKIWLLGLAEIEYDGTRIKDVKKFIQTLESAFHLDTTAVQVNLSLAREDDLSAIVHSSKSRVLPAVVSVDEVEWLLQGVDSEVPNSDHH